MVCTFLQKLLVPPQCEIGGRIPLHSSMRFSDISCWKGLTRASDGLRFEIMDFNVGPGLEWLFELLQDLWRGSFLEGAISAIRWDESFLRFDGLPGSPKQIILGPWGQHSLKNCLWRSWSSKLSHYSAEVQKAPYLPSNSWSRRPSLLILET